LALFVGDFGAFPYAASVAEFYGSDFQEFFGGAGVFPSFARGPAVDWGERE
jgi:hypothetical protein